MPVCLPSRILYLFEVRASTYVIRHHLWLWFVAFHLYIDASDVGFLPGLL